MTNFFTEHFWKTTWKSFLLLNGEYILTFSIFLTFYSNSQLHRTCLAFPNQKASSWIRNDELTVEKIKKLQKLSDGNCKNIASKVISIFHKHLRKDNISFPCCKLDFVETYFERIFYCYIFFCYCFHSKSDINESGYSLREQL